MIHSEAVLQRIHERLAQINTQVADTVCGSLMLRLEAGDPTHGVFTFVGQTNRQMRNIVGTLHGGCAALLLDQAMGTVANCLFADAPHAPTSQLNLNFHRPMEAGMPARVEVCVVNVSNRQIHLSGKIFRMDVPEKLCVSGTAIFFRTERGVLHG